ncbi:hypothetical protein HY639_05060 [Candidatus Woesearchaeota archaeon]|nr:hypothetical protein [Candidatus Woesearchaeota archaeon]
MQKKGSITEEQLFFLADAVFLSLIALSLIFYLSTLQKDTTFEKTYVARDVALLVTTLQTFTGDGVIDYSLPLPLSVELTNEEIIVSEKGIGAIKHPFSRILTISPQKARDVTKITLSKKGGQVMLE